MKKINLKNIVWKEGKYYVAQCLNVDISSLGNTKKEALSNIAEAVELYFEGGNKSEFVEVGKPEIVTTTACYT